MSESEFGATNPLVFENAPVGRLLQVTDADPTPEGWADCDGSTLESYEWPDFVASAGVTMSTFQLPESTREVPDRRFIIKLGTRREPRLPRGRPSGPRRLSPTPE